MIKTIISSDETETKALASSIGQKLSGGEVLELFSDLGGGKTTFTKGLAKGFGYQADVTSPSFTISNEYKTNKGTIYHYDFYRLSDPGIMSYELNESLSDDTGVVVVEWSDIVKDLLPETRLKINIKYLDNKRLIEIDYPKSLEYLLEL